MPVVRMYIWVLLRSLFAMLESTSNPLGCRQGAEQSPQGRGGVSPGGELEGLKAGRARSGK